MKKNLYEVIFVKKEGTKQEEEINVVAATFDEALKKATTHLSEIKVGTTLLGITFLAEIDVE